ncbi:unnamed protein product [Rotaria sp. Silwood2]|nr:unnamed protein product [Rotaria sp. Silwood2]CAF3109296.1 unnamed protein product [Rotaria sp. Silwood2]CAF3430195.1 unnamed protein product [Rotaria sp. Silwood2]CAF4435313.1 unnamed protein product [Rotaria sp. Silwood2]CAF4457511.1 unnamed protein product [Rotaria sp. Silwood2]
MLHLLLYQLTSKKYVQDILDLCYIREILGDTIDDFLDYEDDILKNAFNAYRMYVNLYGANEYAMAKFMKYFLDIQDQYAKIYTAFSIKFPHLMKLQRECDTVQLKYEETRPGVYKITSNLAIPKPIYDENSFRKHFKTANNGRITHDVQGNVDNKTTA